MSSTLAALAARPSIFPCDVMVSNRIQPIICSIKFGALQMNLLRNSHVPLSKGKSISTDAFNINGEKSHCLARTRLKSVRRYSSACQKVAAATQRRRKGLSCRRLKCRCGGFQTIARAIARTAGYSLRRRKLLVHGNGSSNGDSSSDLQG
jgi:hypothetical protein